MTPRTTTAPTARQNGGDALRLRDYQQQAVEFLHNRKRAALFLDMGLG